MRKGEYARHRNVTPAMVSHWTNAGRIVVRPDGLVDVVASDARLAESLDPSRGGKGGKPNRRPPETAAPVGRAAVAAGDRGADSRRDPPLAGDDGAAPDDAFGSFQAARTVRERFAAKAAELAYRKAAGDVVERSDVVRAIVDNLAPAVAKLDTLGARIATRIAGEPDARKVQSLIDAEVAAVRQEVADMAAALAQPAGRGRQ
jgi:hypothetical protein